MEGVGEARTVLRKTAQLLYGLHAVNGQACWVTIFVHSLVACVDHVSQFWDL